MRLRLDVLILVIVFGILAAAVAFGPGNSDDSPESRGTSHSSGNAGTLALYQWLDRIGYQVERLEYRDYALTPADNFLLILAPAASLDADAVAATLAWVEEGGTLLIADDRQRGGLSPLLRALDIDIVVADEAIEFAEAQQPALGEPRTATVPVQTRTHLTFDRADVAVLLAADEQALLIGMQREAGYIYVSSTLRPFTNAGLRDPDAAALVLNLLRRNTADGRILFDEIHHGFVSEPSLRSLLLASPWGWAALYIVLIAVIYLIAGGRRFGAPIPLREEVARRSSSEYLESMAGLLQRAGKRDYLRKHYRQTLKRRLGRPFGVNPNLADDAFIQQLVLAGDLDEQRLRELLQRLDQANLSEAELLRVIAAADTLSVRR